MSSAEAMQRALTEVVSRGDFVVPPYPGVALRLQRLLAREGYGVGEVADVVGADAALAANVLAAANSAQFGAGSAITSVSRAVNRLGARTVGSIAIAAGVGQVATTSGVLHDVRFRVWRRSLTCALACQKLAPARSLDPEEAFLAGLLHCFGRALAIAALEQVLKTNKPPRPLSVSEWLGIAEQHRAALARSVVEAWKLPSAVADAACTPASSAASPLAELVLEADRIAGDLDAGRMPQASRPGDVPLIDALIASVPAALQSFAAAGPAPTQQPSPLVEKPAQVLDGELKSKKLSVVDRRSKNAAELVCLGLTPSGIVVESTRPFQESSVVRLALGADADSFEPWLSVVLCSPNAGRYRVELQLFSPAREAREHWRALYDAP